jgi:methionyl-tRNA synthetase
MPPVATRPTELVTPSPAQTVPYEVFARLDIRMRTVLAAERMVHSKKLTALWMDVGEPQPCCVITGSKHPRPPASFVGLQLPVICNLPPRVLAGKVSERLLLTTYDDIRRQVLLVTQEEVPPGTKAR